MVDSILLQHYHIMEAKSPRNHIKNDDGMVEDFFSLK